MIVEINDEDASFDSLRSLRMTMGLVGASGNRNVVEKTEAHTAIGLGMVARRADQGKDRRSFRDASLDRRDRAAGRPEGHAIGARVDYSVTGG